METLIQRFNTVAATPSMNLPRERVYNDGVMVKTQPINVRQLKIKMHALLP